MAALHWEQPAHSELRLPLASPTFLRGSFTSEASGVDTFLALPAGSKGAAWLNGFHLGRYWNTVPHGPQRTLYVPGPLVLAGRNELIVLELHDLNETQPIARLLDAPLWAHSSDSCHSSAYC